MVDELVTKAPSVSAFEFPRLDPPQKYLQSHPRQSRFRRKPILSPEKNSSCWEKTVGYSPPKATSTLAEAPLKFPVAVMWSGPPLKGAETDRINQTRRTLSRSHGQTLSAS